MRVKVLPYLLLCTGCTTAPAQPAAAAPDVTREIEASSSTQDELGVSSWAAQIGEHKITVVGYGASHQSIVTWEAEESSSEIETRYSLRWVRSSHRSSSPRRPIDRS